MIEGKLINLRTLDMGDLDKNVEWFNDREVTRHLSMRYPLPRRAEEEWLKGQVAVFQSFGPLMYAIETKDGVYLGNINYHIVFPESRKARLGISIGEKAYWSKGYGSDALVTMLRVGFDDMNLHRVDLTVDEDNPRAIACYEKCGFTHEGRMRQSRYTRGGYHDQLVMGILRDEFYAKWGRRETSPAP